MTFTGDGTLIYDIYEENKLRRINMIYRISDDMIISNQPLHPNDQKTKYKLENPNRLILEFEGELTIFRKKIE